MNCERVMESLGAWLDGELASPEAASVGDHVEHCPRCKEEKRRLENLQASLRHAVSAGAGQISFEPFWLGVRQRILEKRPWYLELMDWAQTAFAAPRLAWAVPVVIILLIGIVSLESYLPEWDKESQRSEFASVESIDSHGFNVAVLREAETKTTVIWLFQIQEGENDIRMDPEQTNRTF